MSLGVVGRIQILALFLVMLLLTACSEPWRAPHESRSGAVGRSDVSVVDHRGAYSSTTTGNQDSGDAPGAQTASSSNASSHRVVKDDTLYSIGRRYGVKPEQIKEWNGLPSNQINIGQVLALGPSGSRVADTESDKKQQKPQESQAQAQSVAEATPQKAPEKAPEKPQTTTPVKAAETSTASIPDAAVKKVGGLKWRWPVQGKVMQSFLASDPSRKGIKIQGEEGRIVRAAEGGTIVYSGDGLVGYGELIIIKHNKEYLSAYAYNRKRLVKEGDKVKRGAAVAEMGVNGGKALLHFEIRRKGKPVNPMDYLP